MRLNGKSFLQLLAVIVLVAGRTVPVAQAEGDEGKHEGEERGKIVRFAQGNAKFQQECSTCHIAYPPGMLSTDSWRKIMAGLDNHFGTDATLSAKENEEITAYLEENSTDYWGAELSPLRITETDWFQRAHNFYVIPPDVWKSQAVKSPANCPACHIQAERGDFSEENVKVPK